MLRNVLALVLGGGLIGSLGACVQQPGVTEATKSPGSQASVVKQPVPEDFVNAYAARPDDAFTIPAVPEDKIPEHLRRQEVAYESQDLPGTIVIDPTHKTLHLITAPGKAMRYGIAVGAEGFQWAGEAVIASRKHWPTWTPPKEMIERKPELAKWEKGQPGGPTNPLGARALYLTTNGVDYGFRIHGTPEWKSIGRNASSGCFRMINQDVIDLYNRVPDGVKVVVLNADGTRPTALKLPPPSRKKAAAPKPAPEPVPVSNPGAPAPGFPTMTAPVTSPLVTDAPTVPTPTVMTPAPALPAPQPAAATPEAPILAEPAAPAATAEPVPAELAPAVAACVATAEKPCP
ncbi:MAG: L,D-transpeptidase [Gemmobacter sp.]|jgi:lipoprotein-anchoring transpeptidase ErfK/SrfK|nr:L,D-transpeptidase [Gemmobacter sp.]